MKSLNPNNSMRVYTGHSHGSGVSTIKPNLVVTTGGAQYGSLSFSH